MIKVTLVCSDSEQIKKVRDSIGDSLTFFVLDPSSRTDRKKAIALKSYWGARVDPFAIITDDDQPIKAFYSEAENVINNLILYLNERIN